MADVTIGSSTYQSFVSPADATVYLAADFAREPVWSAVTDADQKGRALVTATRILLARVPWATVPDPAGAVDPAIQNATSMLGADLISNPALAQNPSQASNVRRAFAEGTGVEFFKADDATVTPIPGDIFAVLMAAGLLGSNADAAGPYFSGYQTCPVFDFDYTGPTDEALWNV